MACTFRIAAEDARFGHPEVTVGLTAGYGGTQRLPRLVGRAAALKLLLTGEIIDAREALRIGLVDEVVPVDQLMQRAGQLAAQIARNAPLAISETLQAVNELLGTGAAIRPSSASPSASAASAAPKTKPKAQEPF